MFHSLPRHGHGTGLNRGYPSNHGRDGRAMGLRQITILGVFLAWNDTTGFLIILKVAHPAERLDFKSAGNLRSAIQPAVEGVKKVQIPAGTDRCTVTAVPSTVPYR
ncbi:hypothetical protein C8R46DRAFT_1044497 [Mycena filopes]|nr:hypothetical protein C8R46DRAFT_1044497 [Mycena filopes]